MKKIGMMLGVLILFILSTDRSFGSDKSDVQMSLTGYIQTQYEYHENAKDTFKLLRARPRIKGVLNDQVSFFLQLDFAYDRIMRDIWVELQYCDYAKIRVGQFLLPFGKQTPINPYNLLSVNYAQVVSKLYGGGDLRDVGIMVHGSFKKSDIPVLKLFNYVVAGVNGEGTGSGITELNEEKSFLGRLGFVPHDGLEVGVSGYVGKRGTNKDDRSRMGVDFKYQWENILVQGEYMVSNDDPVDPLVVAHTAEGRGYFVEFGYKITSRFQPVLKIDVWDPDASGTYGSQSKYAAGLNWYIDKWTRLQAFYEVNEEENNKIDNNDFIVQLGIAF